MAENTLRDLFVDQLKDIYDAEQRITKVLPKMAKAARSGELKSAFQTHLEQTEEHVSRLDEVFEAFGESPKRKTCKAIVGLIEEGEELMEESGETVRDAALIAAAQKVEHYEMATYGCLRTWADLLGESEASRLLQQTLDEEGETDEKLNEIAQALNVEAVTGGDEATEEEEESEMGEPAMLPRKTAKRTSSRR